MKWLLFFAIMAGLLVWWRSAQQSQNRRSSVHPRNTPSPQALKMSQCPFCGLRFSAQESPDEYCCEQHRQAIDSRGWWGGAQWIRSPNYDERPAGMPVELVLIHHISLPPGQFGNSYIADFFQNKLDSRAHPYFEEIADRRVSSHFLIKRDGQVQQFVSILHRAWHAGVSEFLGRTRCNDFSIGIELEGTDDLPFEVAQYSALKKLVLAIQKSYPITAYAGHSDVAPGRKTDPGIHFDWELFASHAQIPKNQLPFGTEKR
jgi:AmpD protein